MQTVNKNPIYSGKAKDIFETEEPEILRAFFRDSATAFNAQKKGEIKNKGIVNASISAIIFQLLEQNGIKTHFIKQSSERELLIKKVKIIPLEVIVRNIAAGSLCKRLGLKEGKILNEPIVEFSLKNDALGDPLLTRSYIKNALEIADDKLLDEITLLSLKANEIFKAFFTDVDIKVVDFKLEFGFDKEGNLLIADELSPDNYRFWDSKTNEKLDKDRFRQDLGNVEESYQEILKRVKEGSTKSIKINKNAKTYTVKIQILPKQDILDPQGQACEKALNNLGFKNVKNLRVGREIVFEINTNCLEEASLQVNEMCEKLLANPVIEDYKIEIK